MGRFYVVPMVRLILLVSSCCAFHVPGPSKQIVNHGTRRQRFSIGAFLDTPSSFDATVNWDFGATRVPSSGLVKPLHVGPSGAGSASDDGDAADLTPVRRALVASIWIALVAFAYGPLSPGNPYDPADLELVKSLFSDISTPGNPIYFFIFNALGIYPVMFLSLLCGGGAFREGKQPVPPPPFLFASFALGFFAVGPYLSLRNFVPEGDEEPAGLLEKLATSKLAGLGVLGAVLGLGSGLLPALGDPAALEGYKELFLSSKLVAVSSVDFAILSVVIVDPLREDMIRRGVSPDPAKLALYLVPLVGPALWLLTRPPVVQQGEV